MRRDRHLLYAAVFLRATGLSMLAVLAGAYFVGLALSPAERGAVIAAGLAGCVVASALVAWHGDRWGRRRCVLALGALSALGGAGLALAHDGWAAGVAAFVCMLNAMGRDRGGTLVLEQAMLPAAAGSDHDRTAVMAWHHVWQDIGHALGALAAALPALAIAAGSDADLAMRLAVAGAALLIALAALPYLGLSPAVEAAPAATHAPMSPAGRRITTRLSALFLVDAIGGGFLTTAWLSGFFIERFDASLEALALLFAGARALNAVSHLGAAWLARRIGLVNTMVFTHIPSSILLLTVPIAPSFAVAAALLLLREGLVEMDVPTRQSYLMAVVAPGDRTRANGVTSLVRMAGWTIGQAGAGLAGQAGLGLSLMIGAGMKIGYDVLLYAAFRRVRPPEER
ncbi:MAG TPA: MFS transporter [Planctomycetota bacterium]|nr:MFS transporter [Planctomycetota bacterium]